MTNIFPSIDFYVRFRNYHIRLEATDFLLDVQNESWAIRSLTTLFSVDVSEGRYSNRIRATKQNRTKHIHLENRNLQKYTGKKAKIHQTLETKVTTTSQSPRASPNLQQPLSHSQCDKASSPNKNQKGKKKYVLYNFYTSSCHPKDTLEPDEISIISLKLYKTWNKSSGPSQNPDLTLIEKLWR